MKKVFYVALIVILLCSLSLVAYNNFKYAKEVVLLNPKAGRGINTIQSKLEEVLTFPVDSLTDPENIDYMEIYKSSRNNVEYLTFLNSDINVIYFYDLTSRSLTNTINLNNYGYDISKLIQGYHIVNDDSLFIYSYKNSNLSLLSLKTGKIVSITVNNRAINADENVHPLITTRTPILYDNYNNKVYMPGFMSYEGGPVKLDKRRNVVAELSLKTGVLRHQINYPNNYWGVNWGGGGGLRPTFIDLLNDTLIVSFMADHNIYVYNKNLDKIGTYYFGSDRIKSIRSMKYSNNYLEILNSNEVYEYYLSTPNYSFIKFDRFRKLFYRVAEFDESIVRDRLPRKRKSIIIMDNNFSILGEWKISDEDVDVNEMVICQNGLLIKSTNKSEDNLVLNRYTLKM